MMSKSPLYAPIRGCTACGLRELCAGPVPGDGIWEPVLFSTSAVPWAVHPRIMFIGEAPGKNEDKGGKPFVGQAGKFLDSLLETIDIERESVFISNVVKCRPSSTNRTPTPEEAAFCGDLWLSQEIALVKPDLVVTLGAVASNFILHRGTDAETMEHMHNHPVENVEVAGTAGAHLIPVVLPIYHPASALHEAGEGGTARIRDILDAFQTIKKLHAKASVESLRIKDEYPEPEYRTAAMGASHPTLIALDVETEKDEHGVEELWSVQVSDRPGHATFIPRESWDDSGRGYSRWLGDTVKTVVAHNYTYDSGFVDLSKVKVVDTMVMAYLLGLPQSLKTLARNLCGMEMQSYADVTRPYRHKKALAYLTLANGTEWPSPVPEETLTWVKKEGKLSVKTRKPQHINRKIAKIIADVLEKDANPCSRSGTRSRSPSVSCPTLPSQTRPSPSPSITPAETLTRPSESTSPCSP